MEENKDKKPTLTGKLQLKKLSMLVKSNRTFLMVEVNQSLLKLREKEHFQQLIKKVNDENLQDKDVSKTNEQEIRKVNVDLPKAPREGIKDLNVKHTPKKPPIKPIPDLKKNQSDIKQESPEKNRTPKFPKSPKSFENRRQGKLTISQALDDDNEKVRSLAAIKRAREKAKQRKDDHPELKENTENKEKKKKEIIIPEIITVGELASRLAEKSSNLIKSLMKLGVMATINQTIDADTAELLVLELGHTPKE